MNIKLTRRLAQLALLLTALVGAKAGLAQDFPTKPVRVIVPVGAGSGGDVVVRALGEQLAKSLGQSVIVDNKPGGDGLIAMRALMLSPEDGYSMLLVGPQPMVFNPMLRNDLPYKVSDLRPLTGLLRGWTVLVTGPTSKFTTFESFVAAARANPDVVTIGTDGLSFRIGAALLGNQIGADLRHVLYKDSGQVLNDLSGNLLDVALTDATRVLELVKGGRLRVLAAASKQRLEQLPQVPTIHEKGTDFDFSIWTALAVRAGTPDTVIRRLETDLTKAQNTAEFKAFLAKLGVAWQSPTSSQAVAAEIAQDTARYQAVLKKVAAELDIEKR